MTALLSLFAGRANTHKKGRRKHLFSHSSLTAASAPAFSASSHIFAFLFRQNKRGRGGHPLPPKKTRLFVHTHTNSSTHSCAHTHTYLPKGSTERAPYVPCINHITAFSQTQTHTLSLTQTSTLLSISSLPSVFSFSPFVVLHPPLVRTPRIITLTLQLARSLSA